MKKYTQDTFFNFYIWHKTKYKLIDFYIYANYMDKWIKTIAIYNNWYFIYVQIMHRNKESTDGY